ncbi:MAG: serine/threonine-protein phosphatase [Gemmataceae bacterium]|nr:serine/threonine-protein phosphatase [Gemmataceae bacterium]
MPSSRLQLIDQLVKELSFQDDPDRLIRVFGEQSALLFRHDGLVTVSRRDLEPPRYRITRSWRWQHRVNPWTEAHLLPVFDRGLPGELLHAGRPVLLDHLTLADDDPTREHFAGMQALIAAPAYEQGQALYLVIALRRAAGSFVVADLEALLLNANLIARAATNLMLAQQLQEAYRRLDYELRQVGRMQRHLLPTRLPQVEGLELAATYATCEQAGGDYYDVLAGADGQWRLLVADVSGHGTPAAVVMAMLHTLLHAYPDPSAGPAQVLAHLNRHLLAVAPDGMFATAFYGIYSTAHRRLRYALAGHPAPRLRHAGRAVEPVPETHGLPLGIMAENSWTEAELLLHPGDALLLYTDGILECQNAQGEQFGYARLDDALRLAPPRAEPLVHHVERLARDFCGPGPDMDDRTLLAVVAVP